MTDGSHRGGCLCGAVRFEARGKLREVVYCHCSQCRRQSGHFYAATSLPEAELQVSGGANVTWYAASDFARRGFCRICGSALFWKRNGAPDISVMAGAFDQPTGLKGGLHIFAADKGDYYAIGDDLPVHDLSPTSVPVADS